MSTNYNPTNMLISEYTDFISKLLELDSFDDISLNGIQIGSEDREVKKVAFAVDACQATIDAAVAAGADVLVVHHGLFWGRPIAIKGDHYKRVKKAIDNNLTLFAAHLPLDGHMLYGNNAQMAISLGMREYDPFGYYKGKAIGVKGKLPFPMTVEEIIRLLGLDPVFSTIITDDMERKIESVGIISGCGGDEVRDAIAAGLDCYITGEVMHQNYHTAKEAGLTVISGGHYRTETFGVKALERITKREYDLETVFISAETGL